MIVYATQLLAAADEMEARDSRKGALKNGVTVTAKQLRRAGEILRDGSQPVVNAIRSEMLGFIEPDDQEEGRHLVFQVGILPSTFYWIDPYGRASKQPPATTATAPKRSLLDPDVSGLVGDTE